MNRAALPSEQRVEILKARTRAYRFPKGQSGNPGGQSRLYHEARKIARQASPQAMRDLIELSRTAEDERVRSVCLVAILDRAGIRPYDADIAAEEAAAKQSRNETMIDPDDYTDEERGIILEALNIVVRRREEKERALAGEKRGRVL